MSCGEVECPDARLGDPTQIGVRRALRASLTKPRAGDSLNLEVLFMKRLLGSFAAGSLMVAILGTAFYSAQAKWERPLGQGKCAPPKGSCLRFFHLQVQDGGMNATEVNRLNAEGFDVVYELADGSEVFSPATAKRGTVMVQDIGL